MMKMMILTPEKWIVIGVCFVSWAFTTFQSWPLIDNGVLKRPGNLQNLTQLDPTWTSHDISMIHSIKTGFLWGLKSCIWWCRNTTTDDVMKMEDGNGIAEKCMIEKWLAVIQIMFLLLPEWLLILSIDCYQSQNSLKIPTFFGSIFQDGKCWGANYFGFES